MGEAKRNEIEDSPQLQAYKKACSHGVNKKLIDITMMLAASRVTRVRAEYSGSGDSGQIDGITLYQGDKELVQDEVRKDWPSGQKWDELKQFFYDLLEARGANFNNEGSQGYIEWDLERDHLFHHHEDNLEYDEDYDEETDTWVQKIGEVDVEEHDYEGLPE